MSFIQNTQNIVDFLKENFQNTKTLSDLCEGLLLWVKISPFLVTTEIQDIPAHEKKLESFINNLKQFHRVGDFPTRIVVPATNFMAGFPKLGFSRIKKIFDSNNIDYTRRTIIQASDLKERLENLNINKDKYTIMSLDIVSFYPSIKFNVVKKAVDFFSDNLTRKEKNTISTCLNLIQFGMGNTLLTFQDEYYKHGGSVDPDKRGLTIGGYESAWLADLVAA